MCYVLHSGGNLATVQVESRPKVVGPEEQEKAMLITRRAFMVPWLLSAVVMYALSYLWHGIALTDLQELKIPLWLYLSLSAVVYLLIALGIKMAIHHCIIHEWISLKRAFPLMSTAIGAVVGFVVYLIVFILGMSFASREVVHIAVDILWQMLEQAMGGLMVSLGIIYDMHRSFFDAERAN
jgi:uncharacterized membrane protein YccC